MNKNNIVIGLLIVAVLLLAFIAFKPKNENLSAPQAQYEETKNEQQTTIPNTNNSNSSANAPKTTTNETFINDGTKTPKIYSISPSSISTQGAVVTIKGEYLNGFEGSTPVWFENEAGQSGVVEANSYAPKGPTTITLTLPNKLCTIVIGESGDPCPSYMTLNPGNYKVFVQPYSIPSNILNFTINR